MKTNLLRHFAVALGITTCAVAQADTGAYKAPAKWSNYNNSSNIHLVADHDEGEKSESVEELPVPAFVPAEEAQAVPQPEPEGTAAGAPCHSTPSPYASAVQAPWSGSCARPTAQPISPWFGGANILFLDVDNSGGRRLVVSDATATPYLNTADVNPAANVGFDAHIGRYLGCGTYGLDVGYFLFNPESESYIATPPAAGDWRAAVPAWRDIDVAGTLGTLSVYDYFDAASAYRATRDMRFQGIEANLVSFGIMGARRVGACGTGATPLGNAIAHMTRLGRCGAYGGAGGPLARSCGGNVQVQTLHGFRWFQFEDEFELAGNVDGTPGYQDDDIYYNADTENNMFGYQFGGRLTYCLNSRWNMGIGGKIGIYGNRAERRQRIGSRTAAAYLVASPTDFVDVESADTVLAALGELDLGPRLPPEQCLEPAWADTA